MDTDQKKTYLQTLIQIGLTISIIVSPLIYYPHVQNFSNLPKETFIQFIGYIILALWLLKHLFSEKPSVYVDNALIWYAVWLLFSGVSILWAINKYSGVVLWLHWLMCGFYAVIIANEINTITQLDRMITAVVLGASLIAVLGFCQFYFDYDGVPQAFIPGGTFSNRNMLAQYLILVLPYSILLFLLNKNRKYHGILIIIFTLLFVLLVHTKARSAWLAFFVSFLVLLSIIIFSGFWRDICFLISKEKLAYMVGSIILIIIAINIEPYYAKTDTRKISPAPQESPIKETHIDHSSAITASLVSDKLKGEDYGSVLLSIPKLQEGSANIRFAMWKNSLGMIKDHPVLGTGLENWRFHYPLYNQLYQKDPAFSIQSQPREAHNEFLQIFCETSLIGLVLFAGFFIIVFRKGIEAFRETGDPEMKLRLLFVSMPLSCLLIVSLFTFPLRMSIPPFMMMVTFGIIIAIGPMAMEQNSRYTVQLDSRTAITFFILVIGLLMLTTQFNTKRLFADHHFIRGSYFERIENWPWARHEAQKAVANIPWRYDLWFELGKAYENSGMLDLANDAYLKAIKWHPNHVNTQIQLGHLAILNNDFNEAEFWTEKALQIKPDMEELLFTMGTIKERLNKFNEAKTYYHEILSRHPNDAKANYRLGMLHMMENKSVEAKVYFEKALALNPNIEGIHFQLGALYSALDMLERAESELKKAIDLNPKDAKSHTNLGLIWGRHGAWEKAADAFKTALEIDPELGPAHVNLSLAYYMLKDYESALPHAQKGVALKIPQAAVMVERLETQLRKK